MGYAMVKAQRLEMFSGSPMLHSALTVTAVLVMATSVLGQELRSVQISSTNSQSGTDIISGLDKAQLLTSPELSSPKQSVVYPVDLGIDTATNINIDLTGSPESQYTESQPITDIRSTDVASGKEDTTQGTTNETGQPAPEPEVLVSEVVVLEVDPDLTLTVYEAISTRPGQTTTRSQIQADINAIFATGFFNNVRAEPSDTPLGVRVTFFVKVNPILRAVKIIGNQVLNQEKLDEIFRPQYNQILNLQELQRGIESVNKFYQDSGLILGQVLGAPQIDPDGTVTLQVAEGVVETIDVRYLDFEGEPTEGKTQKSILLKELRTKTGEPLNRDQLQIDVERVFGLGLFEDVQVALEPGQDPQKVNVILNVQERSTGNFSVGFGVSSKSGLFLTGSYNQSNWLGKNQKFSTEVQIGESIFAWQASLTNPGALDPSSNQDALSAAGIAALDAVPDAESTLQRRILEAILDPDKLQEVFSDIRKLDPQAILDDRSELKKSIAVTHFLKALKISERENRSAETALTLNNLGNFYAGNKEYKLAINFYQKAQQKFEILNSPLLELITWIKLADSYRENGQLSRSIASYSNSLKILKKIRVNLTPESAFGDNILQVLKIEWQDDIESLDQELDLLLSLAEVTITLDIGALYSALGDYQQSLYIANSSQLKEVTKKLLYSSSKSIERLISSLDIDLTSLSDNEKILIKIANTFKDRINSSIKNFPEATRLFAFKFIYSDLNEDEIATFYQSEIQQNFGSNIKNYILVAIREVLDLYANDPELLEDIDPDLINAAFLGFEIFIDYAGAQVIDDEDFGQKTPIGFNNKIKSMTNSLLRYLSNPESKVFESAELSELKPFLLSIAHKIAKIINDSPNKNNIDGVVIEITEFILSKWPEDNDFLKKIGSIKSFIYLIQGGAYYKLVNYQKSAESYEFYLESLLGFEDVFYVLLNELSPDSESELVSESDQDSYVKRLIPSFANILSQLDKTLQFDAILKTVEIHSKLGQLSQSKVRYQEALSLIPELLQEGSTFLESEVAEIYYDIAQAGLLVGDLDNVQKFIEAAIYINENFIPGKSLLSESGFTNINFQYGYGETNRGNLTLGFNISANNPWTSSAPSSQESNSPSCTTPVTYFECRQKYFDLYIDLLVRKHANNPSAGFNIRAFEQSERARVRSPQVFQGLSNSIDPSKNFPKIAARKKLLNEPKRLSQIQQIGLEDNTVLIEYFLGEEKSYLWLLSKDRPLQTVELPFPCSD